MTVKVVRGLVGEVKDNLTGTGQPPSEVSNSSAQVQKISESAAKSTEAAFSTIRVAKSTNLTVSTEKIKDPKEATRVAKEVAEEIAHDEPGARGAHSGLSSDSAIKHIKN